MSLQKPKETQEILLENALISIWVSYVESVINKMSHLDSGGQLHTTRSCPHRLYAKARVFRCPREPNTAVVCSFEGEYKL